MDKRAIVIVLDGVGIGALPDAAEYDDEGTHSLAHVATAVGGLTLPTLQALGLGNAAQIPAATEDGAIQIPGLPPAPCPTGAFGKMASLNPGKDSIYGHWELMGCLVDHPLGLFPDGFPADIIARFSERIGTGILGNSTASGTEIIRRLGEEHLRTKKPIIYTSSDSVFQIAAHEEIIPIDRQYEICRIARELMNPLRVGRVIARPFIGQPGNFTRTGNRRDFSMPPVSPTLLDHLEQSQRKVVGLGKIDDLFASRGVSRAVKTTSNKDTMAKLNDEFERSRGGLLFANCNDTDTAYGHRRNPQGYAGALRDVDRGLSALMPKLTSSDLLFICADHGCDPCLQRHTDHTREYVPLLIYSPAIEPGTSLGIRPSFADVGQTIADWFQITGPSAGTSVIPVLINK